VNGGPVVAVLGLGEAGAEILAHVSAMRHADLA